VRRGMKRTLTLLAACTAAGVTLFVVAPFAGARPDAQSSTTVKVTAKDFKFTLSRKSAPHGTVVFKLTNKGPSKHDFKIAGKKTPLLKKGKSATLKVKLTKGKHKYICTVPGHATLGMKGTFKAT
jgi:uncharacterized cupredoxin-like copper-binding protein